MLGFSGDLGSPLRAPELLKRLLLGRDSAVCECQHYGRPVKMAFVSMCLVVDLCL